MELVKLSKKVLSVFLSAILVVTLFPVIPAESAYASDGSTTTTTESSDSDATTSSESVTTYSEEGEENSQETVLSTPGLPDATLVATGVELTWDAVEGAEGYTIYRKTGSSGSWTSIGTSETTSYTDTSVSSNKTYYYAIEAYAGSTKSGHNDTGTSIYVLLSPSLTSADNTSASAIKIGWNSVSGATKYKVYRKKGSSGSWSLVKTTTSTSYTDSSVSNGTEYYYSIVACSSSVESTRDEAGTSIWKLSTPTLKSAENASGGIKVTWSAVSGADGYYVYRKTSGGSWTRIGTVTSSTTTSYTDSSSLKSGTTYYYTVRAYQGSLKNRSYYKTSGISELRLSIPTLKSAENASGGVKVTWSKVTGATKYYVYRKTSGGSWSRIATTTSTSYTDSSSLKSGTTYIYTVRAVKGSDKSYYNTSGISELRLSIPTLKSAENASGGITVTWSKVTGATKYYVYRKTSGGSWTRIDTTTSTSYTDSSSLKSGTTYIYTVRAVSGSDKSYYKTAGISTTKLSTPTLKSAENASGGIKVTWGKVTGATKYYVYRKTSGGSWTRIGSTNSTSYTDSSSLKSGTTYIYTVRAVKGSAKSYYDKSGVSELRLSIPTLKSAENASGGITVTWSKVTGATEYYVYRKTSGGSWSRIATTTSTSYTDSASLKSGTTYIYTVRAVSGSDKSYYKTAGISTTKLSIPSLTSAENASGGIKVTWGKVTGATKYYVYRKTSGGSWSRIATTTSTSYTDSSSLKSGTTYIYTVRAVKGSAKSYYDKSGVSELRLSIPTLKSAKKTSSGITVTWSKVTGAEGYYIYRKKSGGSWSRIATTTSTSYTDTSTTSTSYIYTVRAYSGSDKSYYETAGISVNDAQAKMTSKAQSYSSNTKYLILVNRSTHKVGVYTGSKGNWTLKYYWSCVTGASSTPTITGSYLTTGFYRTKLTTDSRARWATQIYGGYFFHSILVSDSELGGSLSHGCIRLSVSNAKWIYNNIKKGTRVVIYG